MQDRPYVYMYMGLLEFWDVVSAGGLTELL